MLGLGFSLIAFIDVRLNLADQRRLIGVRLGGAFHARPHRSIRPFCRAPSFPKFSLSSTPRCCGSKKTSGVQLFGSERSSASAFPRWATLTACAAQMSQPTRSAQSAANRQGPIAFDVVL